MRLVEAVAPETPRSCWRADLRQDDDGVCVEVSGFAVLAKARDLEDFSVAKRISAREAKYFENLMDFHPRAVGLAGVCRLHQSMLVVLNDAVKAFVEGNGRIRAQQKKLLESLPRGGRRSRRKREVVR